MHHWVLVWYDVPRQNRYDDRFSLKKKIENNLPLLVVVGLIIDHQLAWPLRSWAPVIQVLIGCIQEPNLLGVTIIEKKKKVREGGSLVNMCYRPVYFVLDISPFQPPSAPSPDHRQGRAATWNFFFFQSSCRKTQGSRLCEQKCLPSFVWWKNRFVTVEKLRQARWRLTDFQRLATLLLTPCNNDRTFLLKLQHPRFHFLHLPKFTFPLLITYKVTGVYMPLHLLLCNIDTLGSRMAERHLLFQGDYARPSGFCNTLGVGLAFSIWPTYILSKQQREREGKKKSAQSFCTVSLVLIGALSVRLTVPRGGRETGENHKRLQYCSMSTINVSLHLESPHDQLLIDIYICVLCEAQHA